MLSKPVFSGYGVFTPYYWGIIPAIKLSAPEKVPNFHRASIE
jgi:hypothetical protein